MMKLKNLFLLVIALVVFVGLGAVNVKAEGKVKVYIFEAGGCPYCEAEIEYLESLSSYGEKFEIVREELYIDHVDWKPGSAYELGKTVAEAFQSAGFDNASYLGTPFVVISNIYASAAYSTSLEEVINKAYEDGDKDVVGCYANGGENCLEGADPTITYGGSTNTVDDKKDVEIITTITLLLIIGGAIALVVYTGKKNAEAPVVKEVEVKKEEIKKEVVTKSEKKVTPKKTTNKKSSNKKKK